MSAVAVLEVDPEHLANSTAPLALIYEQAGGNPDVLAFIAASWRHAVNGASSNSS
ncbi:MAG: hypothetical protein R2710_16050 [Acidimicrobiales bacterium]